MRIVTAGVEGHVLADSTCGSMDQFRRSGGARIRVNANITKASTEARLEVGARCRVKRLTGSAKHLIHAGRRLAEGGFGSARFPFLQLLFFLRLAGRAFAADLRWRRGRLNLWRGHAHHLIGDAICFMLKRIIGLSDHELSLDTWLRG